jgi:hypothetical protein
MHFLNMSHSRQRVFLSSVIGPFFYRWAKISHTETTSEHHNSLSVECFFDEGAAPVTIMAAAPKRQERMREKLAE